MKIYLDACCYNRPFDEQTQEKIYLESKAISLIFKRIDNGELELITSEIIELELNLNKDPIKRQFTLNFINIAKNNILLNDDISDKANIYINYGFKDFDALHLAIAEYSGVKYFITTDYKLIKLSKRYINKIKCIVMNPIDFLKEII